MDRLADAIDELYSAHPDGFTGRRKELAAAARSAGDAGAAQAIGELRRPTRSAWVVNALVRSDDAALQSVLDVGAELRAATRKLDGARLRELTARRHEVVEEAVRRAVALSGPQSESVREEVAATFEAALSDSGCADAVSAGTLVRPLEWSGFGGLDGAPALSVVPAPAKTRTRARLTPAEDTDAHAEEEARRRRQVIAQTELAATDDELRQAQQRVDAAQTAVQRLEAELGDARAELKSAQSDRRGAQARHERADRRMRRLGD
jgi:hypothetical protein